MKKHNFNQDEVLNIGSSARKNQAWASFIRISEELEFGVSVSGGNFLTHTLLNGTEEDFKEILSLVKGE